MRFPAPPAPAGDFGSQIDQLKGDGCEMVFLVATPSSTAPAMTKAAQSQFAPQWIGQSPTWIGALGKSALAPYLQANFLVASEGPNYGDASVKGMAELIRIKDTYAPQPGAGRVLQLRLHPGQGGHRPPGEGRGAGRPLARGDPEGQRGAREDQLRRPDR